MKEGQSTFAWKMLSVAASSLVPFCAVIWIASEAAASPKDDIVNGFVKGCIGKQTKAQDCEKLRPQFVEIIKEDLWTLGSSADRKFLPDILRAFTVEELELRIAAAQAFGMIGPQDQDADTLARLANDPVADVRHAVTNAISQGKGKALDLLKQRVVHLRTGREVEKPADAAKFSMPAAPDSAYLFDSSDATKGRLSYVARGKSDPTQFYKAKAKKGPYKWDQFKEQYRYQLKDEDAALDQTQQAAGKQLEREQPPDPATDMEAYVAYMQKLGSVSTQGSMGKMVFDLYQQNLYGDPTVYVLEERQIGQRSYPTRYAVVYQELAFNRPGYRLAWTTASDDALKAAQVASLKEQKDEEAHQAASKKNEEAAKKREAELDSLTKKKDDAGKKQFKKGQSDLEKELGF
ncbi:MAG TPA: HEAT repeat domain-containing protein [Nitrospira sp.]|nr:HEAT repeat domain-containing protein [Nitrospira sp.]